MKTPLAVACVLLLAAVWGAAVPSDVIYTDGEASVRYKTGKRADLEIGDLLDTGDTVTTGYDGFAELDQAGVTVKINPDTVFTLQEKEQAGAKTGVLALVLGSIKFRFDKITGKEPLVQTGACVAGVRGTEFTVFAGADGSSLIVVDSGLVEVEAAGNAVSLGAEEGVEVRPGEAPGQKFKVQRDQVDYRKWNDQKIAGMLKDPVQAVTRLRDRLQYYVDNVDQYNRLFEEYNRRLVQAREKAAQIRASEGDAALDRYNREVVYPLNIDTGNLYLNVRFFSVSALSLRRYVAGRLYVLLKARNLAAADDAEYSAFLDLHHSFLRHFETGIAPYLVDRDI